MAFDSRDNDDFWDIEALIPKKKKRLSPFASGGFTSTHKIVGDGGKDTSERTRLTLTEIGEETEESYAPEGYGLIRRVTIKRLPDRYDFYDSFRRAALLYFDAKGEPCDFVSFYSFMPQYIQLTLEQRAYYFYFRDSVRRGRYIKSDYSYVYLYVYEIINLPDRIPPERGLPMLINLWREYRGSLPNLDNTLIPWIQDYCLVHRLPCPIEAFGDSLAEAISVAPMREFFLSGEGLDSRAVVDALTAQLSDYDWRRGKYSGGENRELFETNMRGALRSVLRALWRSGELSDDGNVRVFARDAFARSLCTHKVKCKLVIERVSLEIAASLRAAVTAAVRYAENRLRAHIGVKSRLGVKGLPDTLKRELDDYFARQSMRGGSLAPKVNIPEYERLYSAPEEKLSDEGADEIERASWTTTLRLVEYGEDAPTVELAAVSTSPEPLPEERSAEKSLSERALSALRLAYDGGEVTDDGLAEELNEYFADVIGDVVLEYDGECYRIIEDYKEEIEEWIK